MKLATLAIVPALAIAGTVAAQEDQPFLGVQMDSTHEAAGVKIQLVIEGSAAERTGFAIGDVILEFDGRPVAEFNELAVWIRSRQVGGAVLVTTEREGEIIHRVAVLGDRNGAGVAPTPRPDLLLGVHQRLAWKAEAAYLAGEWKDLPGLAEAVRRSDADHRAPALEALEEGPRADLAGRLGQVAGRLDWFARQAAREAKAPLCVIEPETDSEVARRRETVVRLVAQLDDPDFQVREEAHRELSAVGPAGRPFLEEALERASIETGHRIQDLLDQMEPTGEDADEPTRERWPIEVEIVALEGRIGKVEARHGTIRARSRFLRATVVREDRARGTVELELDGEGAIELRDGAEVACAAGDRLVWIDVARDPD